MTGRARTAIALVLTLGWGCDYTPGPTSASSPSPSPSGAIPVIVVPVASPGPGPAPVPVASAATFKIVMATPPASSTINVPDNLFAEVHRPILDFEFRYPQNLTLDDDFTNIEITLLTGREGRYGECLWTDLGHSIRLDREDKAYRANSVALFRTGTWRRMIDSSCSRAAPSSFTTSTVFFKLTPDVSRPGELWTFLPMEWTFVVR